MSAGNVASDKSRIFISYRRQDSAFAVDRLASDLRGHFSAAQIFHDIADIEPGSDFVDTLERELENCAAVLVAIGPAWLSIQDRQGRRRLDDPQDWVREEIVASITRPGVRVFPLLVQGAEMPGVDDLPDVLKPLARRQAYELTVKHWGKDVAQLVEVLKRVPGLSAASTPVDERGSGPGHVSEGDSGASEPQPAVPAPQPGPPAASTAAMPERTGDTVPETPITGSPSVEPASGPSAVQEATAHRLSNAHPPKALSAGTASTESVPQVPAPESVARTGEGHGASDEAPPQMAEAIRKLRRPGAASVPQPQAARSPAVPDAAKPVPTRLEPAGAARDEAGASGTADPGIDAERSLFKPFLVIAVVVAVGVIAWLIGGRSPEAPRLAVSTAPTLAPAVTPPAAVSSTPTVDPTPGKTFRDCADCPEMVALPAGPFTMGSPPSEKGRAKDEGPQHSVNFARPFALGITAVTVGEFRKFADVTGYKTEAERNATVGMAILDEEKYKWAYSAGKSWRTPGFAQDDRHPVVGVSWNDANAYAKWLAERTGKGYRLPSEAEREYAARAGTTTARFWGEVSNPACRYANVGDRSLKAKYPDWPWPIHECDDGYAHTAPVGSFQPNAFGLHDMIGNVWEWTQDCWNENYEGAPADGRSWESGDCSRRVVRGGSWFYGPGGARAAERSRSGPADRDAFLGFRLARTF